MSLDESESRTLYVGNLSPQVSEEFMHCLFNQVGHCLHCKIIFEPGSDPYCFVEFGDHGSANQALITMNGREVLGKPMRVNWATSPNAQKQETRKVDTSDHFHVFVGDLSSDIETRNVRDAFGGFGEVSDAKIIKDTATGKSKGYGFVSFVNKEDAQKAINEMNGAWLGSRAIRTNWATRKPPAPVEKQGGNRTRHLQLNYDDVYQQSSETNCTLYIGGIQAGLTEELLRQTFSQYGEVKEVRCFTDKGFAFVRFDSKDAACNGIVSVNGKEVGGYQCRCSWGKESNDTTASSTNFSQNYNTAGQQQQQQQYYNYPQQGYNYGSGGYQAPAPQAQGYGYDQYGGNYSNYGPGYGSGNGNYQQYSGGY